MGAGEMYLPFTVLAGGILGIWAVIDEIPAEPSHVLPPSRVAFVTGHEDGNGLASPYTRELAL